MLSPQGAADWVLLMPDFSPSVFRYTPRQDGAELGNRALYNSLLKAYGRSSCLPPPNAAACSWGKLWVLPQEQALGPCSPSYGCPPASGEMHRATEAHPELNPN